MLKANGSRAETISGGMMAVRLPKYAVFEHRFEESDAFAFQNLFRQMHQYGVDDSRDDECDNHDYDQKQEFVHFVEHMGRNADPGEEFLIPNRMVNAKSFVFINGWKNRSLSCVDSSFRILS